MAKLSIDLVVDDKGNVVIDKTKQNFGKLDQEIRKVNTSAEGLKKIGALVAGGFVLSGLTNLAKDSLEAMDNIVKLSQKVGIGTETLQTYAYAAKLSGIELDSVATSLGKLSKNMVNQTEESDRAFKVLNVSTRDSTGRLRGLDDMMGDIADRFAGMEDGTTKTAIAMNLFGKSGAEMIPLLNQGREGLSEYAKEARRLGLIIDKETLVAVEKFNDDTSRLKLGFQGLVAQALGGVIPVMQQMTQEFLNSAQGADLFVRTGTALGELLKGTAAAGIGVVASFDLIGTAAGEGVAAAVHAIKQIGVALMGGEVEVWQGGSSLEKKLLGYGDLIESFWKQRGGSVSAARPKRPGPNIIDDKANAAAKEAQRQAIEAYKLGAKLEEEQQKRREKMADEYAKIVTDESDFAITENERQINAIISKENSKLGKLYELYLEGAITFEELEKTKTAVEANSAAAQLEIETNKARRIADMNYDLVQDITGMEQTAFSLKMDQIEAQKNKYIADGADTVLAAKWAADQQTKALIKLGKTGDSISGGMSAAFQQLYLDQLTYGQAGYDMMEKTFQAGATAWGDTYYSVIMGDIDNLQDVWDSAWQGMLRSFTDILGQMTMQWGMSKVGSLFNPGGTITINEVLNGNESAAWGYTETASGEIADNVVGASDEFANKVESSSSLWQMMTKESAGLFGEQVGLAGEQFTSILGSGITSIFAAMGIGTALGGAIGGNPTGALIGSLAGFALLGPWGAIGGGIIGGFFHEGGVVGKTAVPQSMFDPSIFASAPRFHGGLRWDEFPAILQRGETVIPKNSPMGEVHNHYNYFNISGSVVTEAELARKLVPQIKKAQKEGAH